jgi:hypothetical protein
MDASARGETLQHTNPYSRRTNRGHNPKYEQGSYVSFGAALCGSKRKNPEAAGGASTKEPVQHKKDLRKDTGKAATEAPTTRKTRQSITSVTLVS